MIQLGRWKFRSPNLLISEYFVVSPGFALLSSWADHDRGTARSDAQRYFLSIIARSPRRGARRRCNSIKQILRSGLRDEAAYYPSAGDR